MMIRKTTYLSAIIIVVGSSTSAVNAQSGSNSIPAEILACADEVDVMQRLSCYDRGIAAATSASEAPATSPVTPQSLAPPEQAPTVPETPAAAVAAPVTAPIAVTATVAKAIDEMPMTASPDDAVDSTPQASRDEANFGLNVPVEDITATVVEIRERPYGEMVIRLDNGQVWEQKHVDRRFRLKIGEAVTITKGAVSGYRLSGTSNRSIQVNRRN